jgi:hypothetical protein
MGTIFFYAVVYFAGYFAIKVINLLTVKPLIQNYYIISLIPVFLFAIAHSYKIVSTPPRGVQDTSLEYALAVYVLMPLVVITLCAIYVKWNNQTDEKDD